MLRTAYAYTDDTPAPPNRFLHYLLAQLMFDDGELPLPNGAAWSDVVAGRYVVVHLNGKTLDNRRENLAWAKYSRALRRVPKWSDGIDK